MGSLLTCLCPLCSLCCPCPCPCLTPETPDARADRLGREAVYRATMAGHYSASTHSFERWVDLSVRPPVTPRCLRRKPIPETTYGALLFDNNRAAAGGPFVTRPSVVLPSVELPSAVLPSVELPLVVGARGQRAESGLYIGEMHRGIPFRSLTPTGSARPISRILGDVRVRNGGVSVESVVEGRKSAAAR